VFYQALRASEAQVVELLNDFDASYNFVDNDGPVFWFHTDLEAPRGRLIAIDSRAPARENWRELIPQSAQTIQAVSTVNQQFFVNYLRDASTQVRVFDLAGRLVREVALPGLGSAGGFGGKRSDTETFYSFTSFNTPAVIQRYDATTGTSSVFRQPKVAFNPDDYETRQVFYTSKDGTRVPMFLSHKKGLKPNGRTPTLLYGYGGFNISLTPAYSVANLVWMEMGGIYAMPNLRGGGEYGEEWHQAGTKLRKQNVFDDFIAAAEWLIANKYTRPDKLAISGGSNGGLLVGACLTQRPDLFGACLPAVGVMDMLRFHKFTIGWAWTSDYGSPDNAEEFAALARYSPYHNLKPGVRYPATLVTTADHDDRVVPAHSFKFAARLQETHRGGNPVLIRIETKAGHGAGKPTTKLIEEAADRLAFLVRTLDVKS
jgi:prolyl oligopeptidase